MRARSLLYGFSRVCIPEFGRCSLGYPLAEFVAYGKDAFLGRAFSSSRRPADAGVEANFFNGVSRVNVCSALRLAIPLARE